MTNKKIQWVNGTPRADALIIRTDFLVGTRETFIDGRRLLRLFTKSYIDLL